MFQYLYLAFDLIFVSGVLWLMGNLGLPRTKADEWREKIAAGNYPLF